MSPPQHLYGCSVFTESCETSLILSWTGQLSVTSEAEVSVASCRLDILIFTSTAFLGLSSLFSVISSFLTQLYSSFLIPGLLNKLYSCFLISGLLNKLYLWFLSLVSWSNCIQVCFFLSRVSWPNCNHNFWSLDQTIQVFWSWPNCNYIFCPLISWPNCNYLFWFFDQSIIIFSDLLPKLLLSFLISWPNYNHVSWSLDQAVFMFSDPGFLEPRLIL